MKYLLFSQILLSNFLIILHHWSLVICHSTSIDGTVHSRENEATWPLQNANLVLMIKPDANHSDVHHLKLNLTQSSFPIRFMLRNLNEIKHTDDYLLSLLIFAYPHRLLWEGVLFRQHLIVETTNSINFTVQDVSGISQCLSHGYPCVDSQTVPDSLISICCSGTRCQRAVDVSRQEYSCGGQSLVDIHVNVTFTIPGRIVPTVGTASQEVIETIRRNFQSSSVPGDLVIIKSVYFVRIRNETSGESLGVLNDRYIMVVDATISTPAECRENKEFCQTQTVDNLKSLKMALVIDNDDGSSALTQLVTPTVHLVNRSDILTELSTREVTHSLPTTRTLTTTAIDSSLSTMGITTLTTALTSFNRSESSSSRATNTSTSMSLSSSTVTQLPILTPVLSTTASTPTISLRWNSTAITVAGTNGSSGTATNQLAFPMGIAFDPSNALYIADMANNRVQKYVVGTSNGTTVAGSQNGSGGESAAQLSGPYDIAVSPSGDVYVADMSNYRVMLWPVNASAGIQFAGTGHYGTNDSELNYPCGIAFDSRTRTLYVSDTLNHRVMKYVQNATSGVVVAGGNGPGMNKTQLWTPTSLHYESATNSLLIANGRVNNVVRWRLGDSQWTLIAGNLNGSSDNTSTGLNNPTDVISDAMGNVYIADSGNHRIQFYLANRTNGKTIAGVTGTAGFNSNQLNKPASLALDNQFNLYVADAKNNRVQQFQNY